MCCPRQILRLGGLWGYGGCFVAVLSAKSPCMRSVVSNEIASKD